MDRLLQKLEEMITAEKSINTGYDTSYDDMGNYYDEGRKEGRIELLQEIFDHLSSDTIAIVKQQLLEAGMKEEEFNMQASDLHIPVTPISKNWLKKYKHKDYVTYYWSDTDRHGWYQVPFATMGDYIKSKFT
jgi:hypothetical protein